MREFLEGVEVPIAMKGEVALETERRDEAVDRLADRSAAGPKHAVVARVRGWGCLTDVVKSLQVQADRLRSGSQRATCQQSVVTCRPSATCVGRLRVRPLVRS